MTVRALPLITIFLLIATVQAAMTIYDSTTNSASLATQLSTMATTCSSAPFKTLGLCNTTCASCESNDDSKCTSCSSGYSFTSGNCLVDTSRYNYTYYNYMGSSKAQNLKTISDFKFDATNEPFSARQLVSVCSASNYEFMTAGLFQSTDVISLTYSRTDPIDQIRIEFYFLSVVQSMKLFITLNDNQIFSKTYTGFSDLVGVYARSNSSSSQSYMTLDALTTSASSIWAKADTDTIDYITSDYTIKFYVQSNSTQKYLWGFKDMTVFTRDCQTCVSKAVSDMIGSTGISIWVTAIIVVVLIIALFVGVAIEQYKRKLQFQENKGTGNTDLPLKAINRVIENIKTIRKAKEKQWSTDLKSYEKSLKKLKSKVPGYRESQL